MASPQKENGYTPIANELLDQIVKQDLNGTQFRIILTIWRYTYGFSRNEAQLSQTFISKHLDSSRTAMSRELNSLIEANIVTVVRQATFNKAAILRINKNYDEWIQVVKRGNKPSTGIHPDTSTGIHPDTQDKQDLKQDLKQDFSAERNPLHAADNKKEIYQQKQLGEQTEDMAPHVEATEVDSQSTVNGIQPQVVIFFLLADGTEYPITDQQVQVWAGLYPGVNVMQQLRNMCAWCDSNPKKRKTKSGIKRFITNWLTKKQDSGGDYGYATRQNSLPSSISPEEAAEIAELRR